MVKNIKIWRRRLEISKEKSDYLVFDKKLDLFIHADKLAFGQHDYQGGWLLMSTKRGTHIGSVWINTDTDIKRVEKFLEETK